MTDPAMRQCAQRSPWDDRLAALAHAVTVLALAHRDGARLRALRDTCESLRLDEDRLAELSEPERAAQLAAFEEKLAAAEGWTLELSDEWPVSDTRQLPLASVAPEVVAAYAGFLARNADRCLPRRDRAEFLAGQLLTERTGQGRIRMRPQAEVGHLLRQMAPFRVSNPEAVAAVGAFFSGAVQRFDTLDTFEQIFESGLYLDARGYKVSLRNDLFDPDILCAAVEFNAHFGLRVRALQEIGAVSESDLRARFEAADEDIQRMFNDAAGAAAPVTYEPLTAPASTPAPAAKPPVGWSTRRKVRVLHVFRVVALAGILAGGTLLVLHRLHSGGLINVNQSELKALSPLLESGSLSTSTGATRFLLGRISSGRWFVMSRSERRAAARSLRTAMKHRHIASAMIYRDDVLAVQVEQGRVLVVE